MDVRIKPNKRDAYYGNPFEEGGDRVRHGRYEREYDEHNIFYAKWTTPLGNME